MKPEKKAKRATQSSPLAKNGKKTIADSTDLKPIRRTQAERRQATQEKLVQGAIGLLKKKRYSGLRTAEVAAAAGVSKGAQTHHFATKDELVLLALEEVYRQSTERSLKKIKGAQQMPKGLIQALIEDSSDFFLGDEFLISLDLLMSGEDGDLGAEVRRLAKLYRLQVERSWLDALISSGMEEKKANDVIWLTFSIGRGLGVRQLMGGASDRFAEVMDTWSKMLITSTAEIKKKRGC